MYMQQNIELLAIFAYHRLAFLVMGYRECTQFRACGGGKGKEKDEVREVHPFYLPLVYLVRGWLKSPQPDIAGQ